MSNLKNQHIREPRKSGRKKQKALLDNVISLRISDQEKRTLAKLTASTSKSMSDVMREAIDLWSANRRKLCMD